MSSKKVDTYAMTLWELAQHGSPVEVAIFERVIGITVTGGPSPKKATDENQRQTFKRFRDWCMAHGLTIEKRKNAPMIDFDSAAALVLAERVRPRLSRRGAKVRPERSPVDASVPVSPSECLITIKEAAHMIGVAAKSLERRLRSKRPPFPSVRSDEWRGYVRVRKADVLAWIEKNTVSK